MMASRGFSITEYLPASCDITSSTLQLLYTITVWYKSVNNAFERERGLTVT
jgi:hypothetical protein